MRATGKLVSGSAKSRIIEMLDLYPAGMHSRDIAAVIGGCEKRTATNLSELGKMALLVSVADPAGQAGNRRRWCAPRHEAACRAAAQASPVKTKAWAKSGLGRVDYKRATALNSVEPLILPGYRPAEIELTAETRYFSAGARPDAMRTGSAIERAYEGRN